MQSDPAQVKNTLVTGGSLTWIEGNFNLHSDTAHDRASKLLHAQISSGAFHNSAERFDAPKCHPRTRVKVLQEILEWANTNKDHPFLWIYGPAGSGKSSIAQSIAETLYESGQLAASFFFARMASERNSDRRLVATIAYQLTLSVPGTSHRIFDIVSQDPAIFSRSLKAQAEALIIQPLSDLAEREGKNTAGEAAICKLILIDGLDECGDGGSQRRILEVLLSTVRDFSLPFCFLIASRPEHDIRTFFNQESVSHLTRSLVLDDKYEPDADIRTFLQSRFDDIRRGHPSGAHLPLTWPSESDVDNLVAKASGQFIYASTVMKFVESPRHWPTDRLKVIFGLMSPGRNTPFADLDALYTHILHSVGDHIERAIEVFTFLLFKGSDVGAGIDIVEDFLCLREGELQTILTDLHSVIYVPEALQAAQQLRLFHASLGDFFMDRSRSVNFFIGAGESHAQMMRYCLRRLTYSFSSPLLYPRRTEPTVLRMSYLGLMRHYPMAHPLHGLLQDLYLFNFEAYLHGIQGEYIPRDHIYRLPSFLRWIKNQKYLNNPQILQHRFMSQIDAYLKASLARYPKVPASFRLFTASTLDKFPKHCRIVFDILSLKYRNGYYSFPHGVRELDMGCLRFSFADNKGIEDFRNMVNEFLTDETRSGPYHIHAGKYMDLAPLLIDLLANPHLFGGVDGIGLWGMQKCCLDLLIDILWRVPADHGLAQYLYGNPVLKYAKHFDVDRREQMIRAVQFYIEKCNRDPATVAALRADALAATDSMMMDERNSYELPHKPPPGNPLPVRNIGVAASAGESSVHQAAPLKKWVSDLFKWTTQRLHHRLNERPPTSATTTTIFKDMPTVKLVVIGSSGVGKTSLRGKYISGRFSNGYRATIGADFITKTLPHPTQPDQSVTLQIWDTAGQERFSSLSTAFFRGADAAILMFDVNAPDTMHSLKKWWGDFCDKAPVVNDMDMNEYCCIVVGNKIDMLGKDGSNGTVSESEALQFLDELVPPLPAATPSLDIDILPPESPIVRPEATLHQNGSALSLHQDSPAKLSPSSSSSSLSPAQSSSNFDNTRSPSIAIASRLESSRARGSSHSPKHHLSKSRSRSSSRFYSGTMTTTHTALTIYHTPSSSLFDTFHSARSSPEPSLSPGDQQEAAISPPASVRQRRMTALSTGSASSGSAPTITPSLFARENGHANPSATHTANGSANTSPLIPSSLVNRSPSSQSMSPIVPPAPSKSQPPLPPERGPKLFFTSAKTGEGVSDVFEYIAQRVVRKWEYEEWVESRVMHFRDASGVSGNQTIRLKPDVWTSKKAWADCCSS